MPEKPISEAPARVNVPGPVLLRRALLVLTATLIVARPLVLGEEPGLQDPLSDPWGLILTLLWLLAAVGWAVWRFWLRASESKAEDSSPDPKNWYGGIVQTALLATVAVVFLSAEFAARYKFPARVIAWEWFGLFVSFFVVRQLAVTPREQNGLFAVLLAGVVSLAAQGVYQRQFIMQQDRELAENPEKLRARWSEMFPLHEISDSELEAVRQRALQNNVFGPYAHPNSYAGYLVLWLPGLLGAAFLAWRTRMSNWQIGLTAFCVVLGFVALWLTHSRGAMLGLAAACVGYGFFVARHALRRHLGAALLGLVLLVAAGYALASSDLLTSGMGKTSGTMAVRLEYWRTTWQMIRERPWLGVGPGNFGENYTRLMPDTAEEKIKAPHNFALETWSNCGIFALLALLVALGAFFFQMLRLTSPLREQGQSAPALRAGDSEPPPVHWEFYLGGMFGLLLGFVLRILVAEPSTIVTEAWAAAVRSVVWFAAYALLERIVWSERGRALALTTGIAALLVNLCVSDGIGLPSVAGPLWVAVALALNAVDLKPTAWLSRGGLTQILPLPIFAVLFVGFGIYVLYPILSSDSLVREAKQAVMLINEEIRKPLAERAPALRGDVDAIIDKSIVGRLREASQLTPGDARLFAQLAWWTGNQWSVKRQKTGRSDSELEKQALEYAKKAVQLDPHGFQGYRVQYELRTLRFGLVHELQAHQKPNQDALFVRENEEAARHQYELAALTLEKYLPNDPHDAERRYELAAAWYRAGDREKGQKNAEEALRLDEITTLPTRRLSDPHRTQLRERLQTPSPR